MTAVNYRRLETLYINRSDSICGSCGRGADPYDRKHDTIMEYSGSAEGCHVQWRFLSSDYSDHDNLHEVIRNMRPDLEWVGPL